MLSKDQILNAKDIKVEEIDVPEWGGSVFVRVMSGKERDAFERTIDDSAGNKRENFRARLAALVISDDKGSRLFDEKDIASLALKSALALDRVCKAGMHLNGVGADEVEELEKNSEETTPDDSGTE